MNPRSQFGHTAVCQIASVLATILAWWLPPEPDKNFTILVIILAQPRGIHFLILLEQDIMELIDFIAINHHKTQQMVLASTRAVPMNRLCWNEMINPFPCEYSLRMFPPTLRSWLCIPLHPLVPQRHISVCSAFITWPEHRAPEIDGALLHERLDTVKE